MNTLPDHIFKAYDIRGLLEEVTPEIARQVGMALVVKTSAKTVIVGRDMRSTSQELSHAAIEGIASMGANVIDIGLCSTSMYNFAVSSQENVDAGLMVTASHNPSKYNGIKMAYNTGVPISGQEILQLIKSGISHAETSGSVSKQNILPLYLDKCITTVSIPDVSGVKIVVDYGNGMGSLSIRPLAAGLGINLIELFPEPDASFPNHEPNPAIEENMLVLRKVVVAERADFGIALDGDSDRIGFVDNEGNTLRGDQMLALLSKDLLLREPGAKVVVSPNQSWISSDTIRENGGEIIEIRIGRTFVIGAMHDFGASLSGEVSGHFFFKEFGGLESVDFAFVNVLGIWRRSGKTFSDLTKDFHNYSNSWEVNLEVRDKAKAISAIEKNYVNRASFVNKLDGIRCEFDRDWWFIIRPSNTEPLLRLIVEATSDELMKEKRDELIAFIKENE
ncbi:phosphomannomutase/phosphoglucomutase [Candidatus Uhrbacteria bacterium]|nr:phosphomannomutase/phosphoglucomutase [Candidatus Uhrbacteria bacterium]